MNKTVNINLAGIFFHIDETAYAKLQNYLESIKRSLTNTQGQDEIIADIEARIAELFNEKIKTDRQVIGVKEVDEVIAVLGQPEDYMLDEEIFDDEPVQARYKNIRKQLFRDTEHSYIGGVSSGLGHYLGIGAVWVRLLWILLTILSSGAFILIYIALWIFVPEAKTTADKLSMRGEEVNISNIERKIREGFDDVSGKMKNVDYEKYGHQARSGASNAAKGVGSGILFLLNIFVKIIGIFILLVAGTTLIGLFIGLFTVGTFGLIDTPWTDYVEMAAIGAPIWLLSLLIFFAVGIPFFFLFILGLKILVSRLKTIGTTAKLVLLGVWLLSIIGLAIIGIQQATQRAFEGEVVITESLPVTPQDTLYLAMQHDTRYGSGINRGSVTIKYDENDNKIIYSTDVRLVVRSTKDSVGRIEIVKMADGSDFRDARDRAEQINYKTVYTDGRLLLDSFLTSDAGNNFREQEVRVTLYLPEGMVLYADGNISSFHRSSDYYGNILTYNSEEKYLTIGENSVICDNCSTEEDEWENSTWDEETQENETPAETEPDSIFEQVEININADGVRIKENDQHTLTLNKKGISFQRS